MTIGEEIKKIRLENNLTQKEFGRRIGRAPSTIACIETNVNYPRLPTVANINNLFDCNIIHKDSILGKKYGLLTVIAYSSTNKHGEYLWKCKCDCGNERIVKQGKLNTNKAKSCGCEKYIDLHDMYKGTRIRSLTQKVRKDNKSGHKGVYHNNRNTWTAQITIVGKKIFLGMFMNKEDAIKAREEAEEKYFKPVIKEFKEVQQ